MKNKYAPSICPVCKLSLVSKDIACSMCADLDSLGTQCVYIKAKFRLFIKKDMSLRETVDAIERAYDLGVKDGKNN